MNAKPKGKANCEIAIVGIGCYYPGAHSPLELWENILSRKQQFREMPDVRLPNNEYYDADPTTPDKTYQNKAAVIDGYEFNWLDRRIPKKTFESTDIVHWLALDTALQALENAGFKKENLPQEKMGVVLGNTLTGEFTRSNQMLLRWPYVRKTLRTSLKTKGLSHLANELEETMEKMYKSVFAPVTEDTLAGGLANTIAGRVCNYLDIHGGGYIVDGACSSSLLAITSAANYLELGQMDVVIAGGVDVSLDTFELIGFAKTGALTQDEMRVYDKKGKGFLPGEGCGMVIMKRMEDAVRDGDKILATLMGWGISSDGKGGITAPSAVGQSKALLRAYRKANFDTSKLDFIEGHGTGTTVGDKTELAGITLALNADKELPKRSCGVTSFKSIVGHTKAAAGVGAFIKTVIALNQRVLPPTAGLKEFNPIFEDQAKTIYPLTYGEVRNPESTVYAGVSAMGFGGINSHTLLRSEQAPLQELKPAIEERKLMVSNQESEVFIFSADTIEELINDLDLAHYISQGISYAELVDFAYYLNTQVVADYKYRAAIVAFTPFDLERKLKLLIEKLEINNNDKQIKLESDTIIFGISNPNVKIGAAFPGQGAQRLNMSYKLKERFTWVEELFKSTDEILEGEGFEPIGDKVFRSIEKIIDQSDKLKWNDVLKQTKHAQPAIVTASLAWYKFLQRLGIEFDYSIGHSLGELTSFFAAGYIDEETLLKFAGFRGHTMSSCGSGTMASLVCSRDIAEGFISRVQGYVTIANINAPEQTVLSGDVEAIDEIVKLAEEEHIAAVKLPVSAAFHSKLIGETADAIRNYEPLAIAKKDEHTVCRVISSVTSKEVNNIELNEYFADQSVNQVNFIDAVKTVKDKCDIMVEVGPGKVLSGLISNISQDVDCYPVAATIDADTSLNVAVANLYVAGANININELYAERLIRSFTPVAERKFLVNPLERPFPQELLASTEVGGAADLSLFTERIDFSDANMGDYMAARGSFVRDMIATDLKHFRAASGSSINAQTTFPMKNSKPAVAKKEIKPPAPIGFEAALYAKLESITGFPASGFTSEMKLLDDFNLDSIKAGTLLAGLSREFNVNGKINGAQYANASISAIIDAFEEVLPKQMQTPQQSAQASIEDTVVDIVADKTGFPKEAIQMDFRLLDDLNLDSIKAGTLMAELVKKYGLTGKIETAAHANATLQQIVDKIKELAPNQDVITEKQSSVDVAELVYAAVEEKTGFGRNALQPDFKLLDDLNLDSIKAGSLLAELSKQLNVQGKIEAVRFANARIDAIIDALESVSGVNDNPDLNETSMPGEDNSWVNAFEVALTEFENDDISGNTYFENKEIVIIRDGIYSHHIQEKVTGVSLVDVNSIHNIKKADILIIPITSGKTIEEIQQVASTLSAVATNQNLRASDLCFIQKGDGYFYRGGKIGEVNCLSALGFASSLHLERPDQNIKVVAFSEDFNVKQIGTSISTILSSNNLFEAIAVSNEKSYIMEYNIAQTSDKKDPIKLNKSDVILITGGAKGITAECGLALSKKFKCKMALVGSSKLSSDSGEIYDTLKRYNDHDLTAKYYSCNISNFEDVESLKETVEKELGTVSVVIHGAGRNIPRLADSVTDDEAISEIAPKVFGASNLIQSFKGNALKQFTAFTSIIGVTGMQGNSWYSFANETTDLLLRNFNAETGVPTLTLAYSVWSEVGMGARMGSVESLSHMGIGAISPDKGIEHFLNWFEKPASDQQVVVASRLGGLDTWKRQNKIIPDGNRYLQDIKYFEPGVEMIAQARLNRKDDLYTDDHNYRGSLLFPTVFGLEAMSQAAAAVAGYSNINSLVLEDITLLKPIVVPDSGDTIIQVAAERINDIQDESVRVRVGVSTEDSEFSDNHFTAEIVIGLKPENEQFKIETGKVLDIDPKTDLYSWLLFQGKTFQLINNVYAITEKQAIFSTKKLTSDTNEICLSEVKQSPFLLGSPLLRDTLLQSFQLSLTRKLVLPVRIKRWAMMNIASQPEGGLVQCDFVKQEGKTYDCNVTYTNNSGDVLEVIEGYQVQELGDQSHNPSPEQIADVQSEVWEKLNSHINELDSEIEIPALILEKGTTLLHRLSTDERHELEQNLLLENKDKISVKGYNTNKLTIQFNDDGKPVLEADNLDISISHSNTWLLMTVGENPQGCDIEMVQHRDESIWEEMLGKQLYELANSIMPDSESKDMCFTRLWSTNEVAFKLCGKPLAEVRHISSSASNILFEVICENQKMNVITFPVEIFPGIHMIFAFAVKSEKKEPEIKKEEDNQKNIVSVQSDEIFNSGYGKFEHDFLVTFKDCRGFYGKTYFTNFPLWMGSLRENVLSPIKDNLLRDLSSGEYGMVTNDSSVHIYNEAESCDKLFGTMSFTDKCDFDNSFMDFKYEWFKKTADGKLVKVADCFLSTTWVKILDRGIVKKDPLPEYFVKFLEKYYSPENITEYTNLIPDQKYFEDADLGKVLYQGTVMPRPEILLLTKQYSTGMHNGNSVGNLYYSNYYDWQAKTIESYLFKIVPEIYLKNGKDGEYFSYTCSVNHLQEAMPFEDIEVKMYLERVNEHSITFFFEYFSLGNGTKRKLSYGSNTLLWCSRDSAEERPEEMALPEKLQEELNKLGVG